MNTQDIFDEIHARYDMLLGETRSYMTKDINSEAYDKVGLFNQVADELGSEIDLLTKNSSKLANQLKEQYVDPLRNIKPNTKILHIERFLLDAIKELNKKRGVESDPSGSGADEDDMQAFHDELQQIFMSYPTPNYELLKSILDKKVDRNNYVYLRMEYIKKMRAKHGTAIDIYEFLTSDFEDLWNKSFIINAKRDVIQQASQQRERLKNLVENRKPRINSAFCRI